ncbi:4Fe-4S single cluster domain-containing protein [Streptomyces sp. NPDC047000]|uniref:4Fe-4S single cluster domain-containing protein n=1 Tax=Streptomyces sp. NPDC047000 TaxID=3155474 RepID=UPI0033D029A8
MGGHLGPGDRVGGHVKVRLGRWVAWTQAEGPGARAALWVQGCAIRCPGCVNPHFWPAQGGSLVEATDLVTVLREGPPVEGVTLLGGEPFEQATALAEFAAGVRAMDLTVMAFTGYRYEELQTNPVPGAADLLAATDLLVDGPYVRTLPDRRRPWAGSTNQRFIALTPRYAQLVAEIENPDTEQGSWHDRLEIHLREDGTVGMSGMSDTRLLGELRRDLGLRHTNGGSGKGP